MRCAPGHARPIAARRLSSENCPERRLAPGAFRGSAVCGACAALVNDDEGNIYMKSTHSTLPLALLAALVLKGPAAAASTETEHREHEAHAHGHGELEVVAEAEALMIALRIPAVNAVGFEHRPSTAEQPQAVEETIARFQRGEELFVAASAADCRLEDAEVELAGMHSDHGHAHEGEKDMKDEHDHEHEADAHAIGAHAPSLAFRAPAPPAVLPGDGARRLPGICAWGSPW